MTVLQAAVLGVVQGVSEFLPISSSGHLVIVQAFFNIPAESVLFEVFVHFATVLAVIFYFKKDILQLSRSELTALLVASIPAGMLGLLFASEIESVFTSLLLVASLLFVTAGLNFYINHKLSAEQKISEVSLKTALVVGLFQAVAILPGISRSGATVAGGLFRGLDRKTAFRFSFLMMIPVVLGASGLQLLEVLDGTVKVVEPVSLLVGGFSAFVTGLASLKLFEYVMRSARASYFAVYCVVVAGTILAVQLI